MVVKPRLLDLFCKAGGTTKGYQRAGFYVVGVDIEPQPHYCGDEFYQTDALEFLESRWQEFDAFSASPPCQAYSNTQKIRGNSHPDLIQPTRDLFKRTGKPYVIENVPGAPLINPITLIGTMFNLKTIRPRLFECSFDVPFILALTPSNKSTKMGRKPKPGEYIQVVGHFTDVKYAQSAMGIDWMTRDELSQAIPPAYTFWIGNQLMRVLNGI